MSNNLTQDDDKPIPDDPDPLPDISDRITCNLAGLSPNKVYATSTVHCNHHDCLGTTFEI